MYHIKDADNQTPKRTFATVTSTDPSPPKRSSYHTQTIIKTPKRTRPSSPNLTLEAHNKIIAQCNIPSISGGIFQSATYFCNLRSQEEMDEKVKKLINTPQFLEIIKTIAQKLKAKNKYNIQELDLFSILKNEKERTYNGSNNGRT